MKRLLLFVILLLTSTAFFAQCKVLVWADEFDQDGLLDNSKWNYQLGGGGWGNNELQYYTARSENVRIENGNLIIEARKEVYKGSQYTSARINSKYAITYGRVEMRAQLPHGRGTWAAMWMMPNQSSYGNGGWPDNGEIDIMEYVGHDSNVVHASLHSHNFNWKNSNVKTNWKKLSGLETGFHTYALEWDSLKMDFYVDNIKYLSVTNDGSGWQSWPYNKDFHLILNLAVGGSWGGEKGVDNTIFPAQYKIDYVRMYSSPGTYLPVSGPAKVFADSIYSYSVPQNDSDVYTWTIPNDASIIGKSDTNVIKVKWGANDGKVILGIKKKCGFYNDTLNVYVYDTVTQTPFGSKVWPIPGKIEAEDFDEGGKGRAYFDKALGNAGNSNYRNGEDVDIEACSDDGGGQNLGYIDSGEWLEYTVDVDSSATYNFLFRVASVAEGAAFHVEMNGVDVSGKIAVSNTGGWQSWQTKKVFNKALSAGKQFMRIVIDNGGFNLNYIEVKEGTISDVGVVEKSAQTFSVFPNPVENELMLPIGGSIILYNTLGEEIRVMEVAGQNIDVASLLPGIYFIVLKNQGTTYTAKFLKR
ncbi:MAG: family 16 glycosylhydrolase [Flavobacteriales bacterium]